jgi:hypothetical protein
VVPSKDRPAAVAKLRAEIASLEAEDKLLTDAATAEGLSVQLRPDVAAAQEEGGGRRRARGRDGG